MAKGKSNIRKSALQKMQQTDGESCYWLWYDSPIKEEPYQSVLTTTPAKALSKAAHKNRVKEIWDVTRLRFWQVANGAIV